MQRTRWACYTPPRVWSLDSDAIRDLLGPAESQYSMTTVSSSCLPLDITRGCSPVCD